jgi:hypothetical protein
VSADALDLPQPMLAWTPARPSAYEATRLVIVQDPALGDVRVRWRIPRPAGAWIWRCGACGCQVATTCPHTYAAALHLAETILGLFPVHPTAGRSTGGPGDPSRPSGDPRPTPTARPADRTRHRDDVIGGVEA